MDPERAMPPPPPDDEAALQPAADKRWAKDPPRRAQAWPREFFYRPQFVDDFLGVRSVLHHGRRRVERVARAQ